MQIATQLLNQVEINSCVLNHVEYQIYIHSIVVHISSRFKLGIKKGVRIGKN